MTPRSLIEPARHAGTALLRSQTDARLVDLTRDGNERAFEAIVQRYSKPLMRYCTRLLPPARAEDAVQQAFLSAHRAIHAGDAELNLRPWLYRIAHNASLNLLRQQGYDHDEVSEQIDGVETPPQAFERGERLRTVVAAVQELPSRQRDAIVLQAVEGRSYEEIAAELGVSDGAVRQLLNRARNTLREAAAALTPSGLLARLAASSGDGSVAERIAGSVGGAGGGALLAKAGATLVVAGAVAGGAATGSLPGIGGHHGPRAGGASASAPDARTAAAAGGARAAAVIGGPGGVATPGVHGQFTAVRLGHSAAPTGPHGSRHGGGHSGGGGSFGHSGRGPSAPSGHTGSGGAGGGGDGGSSHSGSGSSDSGSGSGSHSGDGGSSSGSSGSGDSGHSSSGDSGSSGTGSGDFSSSGSGSSGSGGSGSDGSTTVTQTAPVTSTDSSGHDRSGSGSSDGSSGTDSSDTSDGGSTH